MAGATGDVIQAAKAKVQLPAIGLIVTGVITLCMVGYGLATSGGKDFDAQWDEEIRKIEQDQSKTADQKKQTIDMMNKIKDVIKPLAGFTILFQVLAVAVGALAVFAGIRVMALKNRGLGIASSILSMVPCVSCCCLGIPFGIWLIITLSNPVVKRGFEVAAGGSVGGPADDLDPGFGR
jgi:hypothetical protein